MTKKRSSFWTVVFSFLPGAGHMFMGFMKAGLSLMALFFGIIALSSWMDLGPLLYLLPVLWFYAFFDALNRRFCSDEEFARMEDHFMFPLRGMPTSFSRYPQRRLALAVVLIAFGAYMLAQNFFSRLVFLLPDVWEQSLSTVWHTLPQTVVGVAIIVLGVWMIVGKRKGDDSHA